MNLSIGVLQILMVDDYSSIDVCEFFVFVVLIEPEATLLSLSWLPEPLIAPIRPCFNVENSKSIHIPLQILSR